MLSLCLSHTSHTEAAGAEHRVLLLQQGNWVTPKAPENLRICDSQRHLGASFPWLASILVGLIVQLWGLGSGGGREYLKGSK